jgi:putative endonuclease
LKSANEKSVRPAHLRAGDRAEELARQYLERQGLRCVQSNYRCRLGELDLVMRDGSLLVVVEIRYRCNPGPVPPEATVGIAKRRKILRATRHFLQQAPALQDCAVRFDILALSGPLDRAKLQWLRGAFDGEGRA